MIFIVYFGEGCMLVFNVLDVMYCDVFFEFKMLLKKFSEVLGKVYDV